MPSALKDGVDIGQRTNGKRKEQMMSEKIYRVQMNSKGMPNFSTAVEVADRPQGEWIEMYRDGFGNMICMCSKCNFHTTKSNYCPNCGAQMKGAKNDSRGTNKETSETG